MKTTFRLAHTRFVTELVPDPVILAVHAVFTSRPSQARHSSFLMYFKPPNNAGGEKVG